MHNRIARTTPKYFRWLWIREPRTWLGHQLSDVGNALAQLGARLTGEAAGGYSDGFRDGLRLARATEVSKHRAQEAFAERHRDSPM